VKNINVSKGRVPSWTRYAQKKKKCLKSGLRAA